MVLNLTSKKFSTFSAPQVLATRSEEVVDFPCRDIFKVEEWYDLHSGFVSTVIVGTDIIDHVFNNDVCNIVSCDVVTLDVEICVDSGEHRFVPYNPDELFAPEAL